MLIETMIICSLLGNAPFYDCDNEWTINMYDEEGTSGACHNPGYACVQYNYTDYGGIMHIPADYNHILMPERVKDPETGREYKQYRDNMTDWCGNNILWHEIRHLIMRVPDWNDNQCDDTANDHSYKLKNFG